LTHDWKLFWKPPQQEPAYADFLLHVMSTESDAGATLSEDAAPTGAPAVIKTSISSTCLSTSIDVRQIRELRNVAFRA